MISNIRADPPLLLRRRARAKTMVSTSDLARQMFVRYDNGDLVVITPKGGGYQEIEDVFASGDAPLKYEAYRGLYILREYEAAPNGKPIPGTEMRVEFPVRPEELPEPIPGAGWQGIVVKRFDDGRSQVSDMEIRFSSAEAIELDATRYGVVRADLVFDRATDQRMDVRYLYLPALRTALFVSSKIACHRPMRIAPVGITKTQ